MILLSMPRVRAVAYGLLLLPILALAGPAYAACTPLASSGQPPAGTTVTCVDTTINQNDPVGYGDGSQTGLTIDVQTMATVSGTIAGFSLGATNMIVNAGTIGDTRTNPTSVNGIVTSGSIDLTNTPTGVISVATTSTNGFAAAVNSQTSLTGSNAGLISASADGSEAVAAQSNAINFTNTGTITASGSNSGGTLGLFGLNSLMLTNSGMISADGGTGQQGTAVTTLGTLNVINLVGGVIQGTETNTNLASVGVFAGGSGGTNDQATIGNAGTIHGDDFGIVSFSDTSTTITNNGTISGGIRAILVAGSGASNITNAASGIISADGPIVTDGINTAAATTIDNSGMISSTGRSGVRVGNNASITNESGGTITGVAGIVFRDPTGMGTPIVNGSVFNAGTITGTGGTAINFAFTPGSGPMTLTLGPGSVINGNVLGTGGDTLNLGGTGSDTFDVDRVGATRQYQGFSTFNKIGSSTWTLTGTGAQNWSVQAGTLVGDTNSLGGATIPVSAGATLEFNQNFDGTYAGMVSGGGTLVKDGAAGEVLLTGDNTYTGGTMIAHGDLILGAGGTTGSIVGDVTDNGNFVFNRSDTITFSGVISGIGNLGQNGFGTTILTAANTYAGVTTIQSGTLALVGAGSIANSSNVEDNATFDISGTAGGVSIQSLGGGGLVVLGANTLTLTNAVEEFSGVIGGTGGLVLAAGTETLSGDNTYTGSTTISGGTLQLGNGGTTGSIVGDVTDNGSLAIDRADTLTISGAISGNGTLQQNGMGTTILTGVNTYRSGTFIASGTLALQGAGSIANSSDVVDNATFDISGSAGGVSIQSLEGDGTVVLGANTLTLTNSVDDFTGVISGTGGLTLTSGTETLSGDNTYTGGTTITSGTLALDGAGSIANSASVQVATSATFDISGAAGRVSIQTLGGNGSVVLGANTLTLTNADDDFSGVIGGTGGLVLAAGTEILSGDNTYIGSTTISNGTLQLGNGGSTGSVVGDITDNGTLAIDRSNTLIISGVISGSGTLQQNGTGTTILATDNTYGGGTTITSGTLQIGNGGTTGSIQDDVVDDGTLAFDRSDAIVFSGAISGSGDLTLFGSSKVTLTGSYSYTGQTTIGAPIPLAPVMAPQPPPGSGTLVLAGGKNTLTGDILDNGVLVGDATSLTLSGKISGSGSLSVEGGATTLGGNNTYAGGTIVANGTLSISADDNLGTGGLALLNGPTLQLTASFMLSHAITVAGDPTFDVSGGNTVEINAPITDGATPGDVVKTGSGTLLLTAANTYTGGTFVNGGTLQLGDLSNSGSIVGAITLSPSAVLDVVNSDFSQATTVTNDNGSVRFEGTSSAATAQISVTDGGGLTFDSTATAGQAQIAIGGNNGVNQSVAAFLESASAGNANIAVTNGGLVILQQTATAADSTISVSGGSAIVFFGMATAGNAQISASQNGPAIAFDQNTTAGTAKLSLSQQAILEFTDQASADHAQIVTSSGTVAEFLDSSTAANAQIDATAGGGIAFFRNSTAGQAQITLGGGATLSFSDMSSGGLAGVTTAAGTHVNFAGLASGGTTIGSINGAGDVIIGANALTIGSDNSNSEIGGLFFGSGNLTKLGTGTLTLDGSLVYSGTATISQGTLVLGGGDNRFAGAVVDNGALTLAATGTLTLSGKVSGSGSVTENGTGTTILTADNTYTGGTTITAGTLQIGNGGTTGSIQGDVTDNGALAFDRSDTVTFAGVISGSGDVSQIGSGTTILTGANTYNGFTFISEGTLALAGPGSIATNTRLVNVSGGATFDISGAAGVVSIGSLEGLGSVVLGADTLTLTGATDGEFSGVISGSGRLVVGGGQILSGNNTYTGGTTITTTGVLRLGNFGTTGSIVGNVIDNGELQFARSDTLTLDGVISGSGSLTQIGSGTTILTAANTYAGKTFIITGTLALAGAGSIANSSFVDVHAPSTTFDISGASGGVSIQSLTGAGAVVLGANTLTLTSASNAFSGVISSSGGLSLAAGSELFNGVNTYTGATTISGGTLFLLGADSIASSKDVVDSATLDISLTDGGVSIQSLDGNGSLVLGANTLTLTNANSGDFSGVISGTGGLVLSSGSETLSGANTYTGGTTVSGGTLDVNGSIANSAVTVNSGATLKGNGTVGNLTLASGSTVAPGNSIGTLHVAGNVTFTSGSIFQVEANSAGMSDLIDATGTATIQSGATVQVIETGVIHAVTTYKIVAAAGGVSGTFGGFSLNVEGLMGQPIYGANFVDLELTPADIDLAPFTHTPNEIATAAAVKAAGPGGAIFGAFLAAQPDTAFITGALDQLSGEIHPSLETAELEDTQVVRQSVLDRLRQSASGDSSGLLAPTAAQSRTIVDGLTMWTHVFAATGSVDSDGNAAEIRQNESGILAGIDAALGHNATLGIGGGYTHSHLNQRTSSSSGGDDYIIASGGWSNGPLALRAGGSYAWGDRNVTRHVSFPGFVETLISKQDEHASQIFGEAAYSGKISDVALEPFAGMSWIDATTAAFSETGGSAALSGKGGDTSLAYSSLGLRLATNAIGGESLALTPRVSLAWQHAFGSVRPQQVVTFNDTQQSFLVLGTPIDRDAADVDVGFDADIGSGGKFGIGYEGVLSSRVRLNTIHAGFNWTF